ncbi:hemagglutinin repeat-containing protein [Thalassospira lucentensis]|uniref:Filamentous haemagglutinin FhaB/tRNA nuclease CdiA-like TPS domain-containing protein n=1 Tax=Thalassospira lucentensis TaxID=168935 RepID=A0A358HXB1_9PROT|nr:hemagglutinin repeat-containing protein [Thalassospira lucentensis]HBU99642.1 hypothetical protein [Thalassospira lucentensis]HCW67622.1 hypothetical protein [Thalassospira lucentensis]|tara:strand:- start:1873 stop:8772 length:6900 start_codon:yes stop_codon:yes gene_type:complete
MQYISKLLPCLQKSSALIAAVLYTLSPVVAGAQQAANTDRSAVDQSRNGLTIYNINTPNAKGLSNNIHNSFDIPTRGAIDNNSATITYSQLEKGFIEGNPNLTSGREASTILHQIIGGSRSEMNGLLEVAGKKAQLVIVNENGITCNGCGFINTSRATLSTGAANINASGELAGFDVTRGDILINGTGLDAVSGNQASDQIDLIARTVAIRDAAKLRAKQLNVITGSNSVDYAALTHSKIAGSGAVPEVALDVAALGGMYADYISLIATDDGVGVNMNGSAASAGNLTLDANGKISFGAASKVSSGAETTITTTEDFEGAGSVKSAGNLTVTAKNITNSGELNSGAIVSLEAQEQITSGKTAMIRSENDTSLKAGTGIENNGVVAAYGDLDIDAPDIRNDGGILWANDNVTIGSSEAANGRADYVLNRNGRIEAFGGDLEIKAENIVNQGTAPTANIKDNIYQFYETPGPVNPNGDIKSRLVSATFLAEDGTVRPEYTESYVALWEQLFSDDLSNATELDPEILVLLQTSAVGGGGNTLGSSWVTYFGRLTGKASEAGVPSLVELMRGLMADTARVEEVVAEPEPAEPGGAGGAPDAPTDPEPVVEGPEPGSIKAEYLPQYLALWESLSSGQSISADTLAALDPSYVKDGKILPQISNLWNSIRSGSGANYTILVTITQDTLNDDGVLAELKAGKNIRLEAKNINNIYGAIQAAGDLDITAENLTNTSFGASQSRHEVHKRGCFTCHEGVLDFADTFGGVIQAHGNLNISVTDSLKNMTIGSRSASQLLADIGVHLQSTSNRLNAEVPKPAKSTVAPKPTTSTPGAATSTLVNLIAELEEVLEEAHENFETPESGELDAFMSSPYLFSRLDFEPLIEQNELRAFEVLSSNDPTVRQAWATQQIRTAQLLGGEGAGQTRSDVISEQLELALALPTSSYNGAKPLSAVTAFLDKRNGALISADKVDIAANEVKQIGGGQIVSDSETTITADQIDLERGDLKSGGDISLSGDQEVRLAAVDIEAANDVTLKSDNGDVSIETIEERTEFTREFYSDVHVRNPNCSSGDGDCEQYTTKRVKTGSGKGTSVTHQGGTLNIGGNLTVEAANDVSVVGTEANVDGDVKLAAGGDLLVGSARNVYDYSQTSGKSSSKAHSEGLLTSAINAGGNIAMTGTNVGIDASTVSADGKLDVMAYNDLSITAGMENSSYSYKSSSGGGGFFSKKKSESLDENHLTYQESVLSSGDDMSLNAMGNIGIAGSEVESGGDIDITAFGGLTITSLQEQHHREHKVEKSGPFGGMFGGSSSRTEIRDLTEVKGTEITSLTDLTTQSGSDTTIRASRVSAGGDLKISVGKGPFADPDAKLWLLTDKDRDYLSVSEYEGGTLKWTMTEYGHEKEVVRHAILESGGDFIIESPGGVVVEYRSTGDFTTDIAQLAEAPGLEYLADLQGMDNVDWQGVEEIYETWYDQSSGLGGGAMAIIAIATAILTAGATAGLAAAISGATTTASIGATTTIVAGTTYFGTAAQITSMIAVNAAFSSIAATAATSIANGAVSGDMRGAFQSIFSSDTLRGAAISLLTAGATRGGAEAFGLDLAKTKDIVNNVGSTVAYEMIRTVANTAADSIINGTDIDDALVASLHSSATAIASSVLFSQVGKLGVEWNLEEGDIEKVVMHAVAGCGVGMVASRNCVAGAVSAGLQEALSDTLNQVDDLQLRVQLAGLSGAMAIALTGGDAEAVNVANMIGQQAAIYNRQLHTDELLAVEKKAKELAGTDGKSADEWHQLLQQEAMRQTDKQWNGQFEGTENTTVLNALAELRTEYGSDFVSKLGDQFRFLEQDSHFDDQLVFAQNLITHADSYNVALEGWSPYGGDLPDSITPAQAALVYSLYTPGQNGEGGLSADLYGSEEILERLDPSQTATEVSRGYALLQIRNELEVTQALANAEFLATENAWKAVEQVVDQRQDAVKTLTEAYEDNPNAETLTALEAAKTELSGAQEQLGVALDELTVADQLRYQAGKGVERAAIHTGDAVQRGAQAGVVDALAEPYKDFAEGVVLVSMAMNGDEASQTELDQTWKSIVWLANNPDQLPDAIADSLTASLNEAQAAFEAGDYSAAGEIAGNLQTQLLIAINSTAMSAELLMVSKGLTRADTIGSSGFKITVDIRKLPTELAWETSSEVKLVISPHKTTTILGSYAKDMEHIIAEMEYPKTFDFGSKIGGFNVLNTPDSFNKNPNQFWNDYNKPFLDDAIQRGDDIVLATKPIDDYLNRIDPVTGSQVRTGFGKEYDYLKSNGYEYDSITSMMRKQ